MTKARIVKERTSAPILNEWEFISQSWRNGSKLVSSDNYKTKHLLARIFEFQSTAKTSLATLTFGFAILKMNQLSMVYSLQSSRKNAIILTRQFYTDFPRPSSLLADYIYSVHLLIPPNGAG